MTSFPALRQSACCLILTASACSLLLSGQAQARDDDDHGARHTAGRATPGAAAASPVYVQECGACHVAYPPGLLPAASWQRLIGHLDKHFGVDASLDEVALQQIRAHVQAGAGSNRRVREVPPDDRITRSAWFVRKHDEVSARTWKLPAVKSASNCSACHAQAQQGDFNENDVRIPR
jgi:cytochrome c5